MLTKKLDAQKVQGTSNAQLNKNVSSTETKFSQSVLDALNKVEIKDSAQREKNFLYKFQQSENKLTDKESKKMRSKLRNELTRITNNILIYAKTSNSAKLAEEKINLLNYQKNNLTSDKFETSAFYQGSEEKRKNEITVCLQICNELK